MKFSWNRCLARVMDYGLFYFVGVILSLVLPFDFQDKFYLTFALQVPVLWALIEALLLSSWGTTPGKWLFGVAIRNENGDKLPFFQSLKRAFFIGKRPGIAQYKRRVHGWRYLVAFVIAIASASSLFLGKDLSDVAVQFEKQMVGEWVQYISDDGRFTVNFPKQPKVESHSYEVPDSQHSLEMSELKAKSDAIFSVSYVELPKKWRIFSAGTLLKAAMQVVHAHTPNAELLGTNRIKHKDYPAMDFRMKEGDNEVEGRLILVGSTLYKLTVTYPPKAPREMQHETFLNSFELKSNTD